MKRFMANYSRPVAWYLVIGSSIFAAAWLFAMGLTAVTFVSHGFQPAPIPLVNTTLVISSLLGLPMLAVLFFGIPAMLLDRSVFGS